MWARLVGPHLSIPCLKVTWHFPSKACKIRVFWDMAQTDRDSKTVNSAHGMFWNGIGSLLYECGRKIVEN